MPRRRRQQGLERVLGTPALFATAYGNVGSSIYYALGVTAAFALGLTPIVFLIAGVIFVVSSLHLLYVNTHLLPPELRPPLWRRATLVFMALFYATFVALSVRAIMRGVRE